MPDDGARRVSPGPLRPGSLLARAREHLQAAEIHGWLARLPAEARVAAALAEAELEATVVAFAMGNAQEP